MARRGAAGSEGRLHQQTGGVQILDALPRRSTVDFDVTILTSTLATREVNARDTQRWFGGTSPFRKLIADFDLQPKYAITPTRFAIGNQFRHGLGTAASALGRGGTPPYQLESELVEATIGVSPGVHRYGEFYLPTLRFEGTFEIESLSDVLPAFANIVRSVVRPRRHLLAEIAALSAGADRAGIETLGKVRTHARLEVSDPQLDVNETRFAEWLTTQRRAIVATHIAQDPDQVVDPRLERALWESNSELNLKSQSELLILNAQGSTLIAPARGLTRSAKRIPPQYLNRHERVVQLSEVATFMQHALLRARALEEIASQDWAADSSVIERWVAYPINVFHTSVSNERIWRAISDALALRSLVQEIHEIRGIDNQARKS